MDFAHHKFASNVVEKCLQHASKEDRNDMLWSIVNANFAPIAPIAPIAATAKNDLIREDRSSAEDVGVEPGTLDSAGGAGEVEVSVSVAKYEGQPLLMMEGQYGNYVLQKVIELCSEEQLAVIVEVCQ